MPCLFDTLMYCVFSFVVIFWITVQVRFGASLLIKEPARTARASPKAQKPKSPKKAQNQSACDVCVRCNYCRKLPPLVKRYQNISGRLAPAVEVEFASTATPLSVSIKRAVFFSVAVQNTEINAVGCKNRFNVGAFTVRCSRTWCKRIPM